MRRRDLSKTFLAVAAGAAATAGKATEIKPIDYGKWPSPWHDISRFVTDNTGKVDVAAQMRAAFKAERSLVIPEGTYLLNSEVVVPQTGIAIQGAGQTRTVLKLRGAPKGAACLHWPAFAQDVNVSGLGIDLISTGGGAYQGLRFAELRDSNIDNVHVIGSSVKGADDSTLIRLDGTGTYTGNVNITRCLLNNAFIGIDLAGTCTTVRISDNEFICGSGLTKGSRGVSISNRCGGPVIELNSFWGWFRGVYSEGAAVRQLGNYYEANTASWEWARGASHPRIWNVSLGEVFISGGNPIYPFNDTDACTVMSGPGIVDFDNSRVNARRGFRERGRPEAVGEWTSDGFAAENYSANRGKWTVTVGQQTTFEYTRIGTTMLVNWRVDGSSLDSASSTQLTLRMPQSVTARKSVGVTCYLDDGVKAIGKAELGAGSGLLRLEKVDGGNFAAGPLSTYGQIAFETT
jgi:hypothetical protein